MKAIPASKLNNLNDENETDLSKQTSSYVNQQRNYTDQSAFYINHANIETNCYAALQDGGWTKNDYQELQG